MSRHHVLLVLDVDDEALAEHVQVSEARGGPFTVDPQAWDATDVFALEHLGIVDPCDATYAYGGEVK
jgi:hypothetical protein